MKLGAHFQGAPSQDMAGVVNGRRMWAKLIDPPDRNPFGPGVNVVGRVYMTDSQANDLMRQGAAGGEAWYNYCKPVYNRAPYVLWWEFVNESPVNDAGYNAQLAAAIVRWTELMHARGLKCIAPVISVGNPAGADDTERRALIAALLPGFRAADGWAYHAYWVPPGPDEWYALRYRLTTRLLGELGVPAKPVFLTEAGVDGGIAGRPGQGWQGYGSIGAFAAECAAFDAETEKDAYVVTWQPFTSSVTDAHWRTFGTETEHFGPIIAAIGAGGQPPAPPQTGGGVEIYDRFGNKRDWAWLTATYGDVRLYKQTGARFALVRIDETEGPSTLVVRVLNKAGQPQVGQPAADAWPNPEVGGNVRDLRGAGLKRTYADIACVQAVGGDGYTGFGLYIQSYYTPPDRGAHTVWVCSPSVDSDGISGIGMLPGTEHRGPLSLVFQLVDADPVPPPAPPEDGFSRALATEFGPRFVDMRATLPHGPAPYSTRDEGAISQVVVHHTAVDPSVSWETIAAYHVGTNKWPGIGYHVGVSQDGTVALLNSLASVTYHVGTIATPQDDNLAAVGVCVAGNFETGVPSAAAVDALAGVVRTIDAYLAREVALIGHRDIVTPAETVCPGANLYKLVAALRTGGQEDLAQKMLLLGQMHQAIQLNPGAALQRVILADGMVPTSGEFDARVNGVDYVAQRAEGLRDGSVRVYYCPVSNYSDVRFVAR